MRDIYIKDRRALLNIGRRRENLATQVIYSGYPDDGYSIQVFVKRNGDSTAYPASNVVIDSTERVIRWNVTSTDTDKQGTGEVQFRYANQSGVVVKTEIYSFIVTAAIDADPGPAPDPYETWLDSLTDLAGETQVNARAAAQSATDAAASAEAASGSASNAESSAESAESSAMASATSAAASALSAQAAAQSASSADGSADRAGQKATEATASASQAAASASSASASAASALTSAQSASVDASRAEQAAAQSGYMWFYIEDGKLYMDRTPNTQVDFYMEDGKLYVTEAS